MLEQSTEPALFGNTGIRERVIQEIRTLARRHGVKKVILFGSRARGDYRMKSDIDLAFEGGDAPRFILDVDEETYTLLSFDVISLDAPVSPELRDSIRREGVVIYEQV